MKRGFTLHEMIISLTVMSGVIIIAGHFASQQTEFLRSFNEGQTTRGQLGEAVAIPAALLRNVNSRAGDIVVGEDTILELRATTGVAVVCASAPGEVVIPAPNLGREATSAFFSNPQPGDRIDALFADSAGTSWIALSVVSVTSVETPCPRYTAATSSMRITLDQPIPVPPGAPLRFTRPFRMNHYRSSDGRWYLGGRDWNGEDRQFNTVQPLAGPLASRGGGESPGLAFEFLDATGAVLSRPWAAGQVALVAVTARAPRGLNGLPGDSTMVVVALRR